MQTASKKVVNGWAMYDWANSAYNLVITSTIFPAYFEAIAADDKAVSKTTVTFLGRHFENSSLYNYVLAFAMLIVAVISPLLSSIADYKGNKKNFMNFFLTMGSIACAALFFFNTTTGTTASHATNLGIGMACMVIACVGYWGSVVFYNSFLPEIAAPKDRDRISAKGFSYGYVGSVILQVICFIFVFKPDLLGGFDDGNTASTIQFRLSFLLVGIWWWGFGQYSLRVLPKPVPAGSGDLKHKILSKGYKELRKVWHELKGQPLLKRFLFSFFFFNMGVQTVMLVAALYGKSELNIPTSNLIIAILIIQLIAVPGAIVISRLSARIGNIRTLMILVMIWIGLCVVGYLLPRDGIYEFYGLATGVGFVMGGIQALSRSTYSKLMPETKDTTSFFSFYDVTEKIAAVIGIFSFGFINELTGSQRSSVLALMAFFIIGLFGLYITRLKQKQLDVHLNGD
jgi:UMF1 family MFS transporter